MSLGQNDNYLILEFTKLKDEVKRLDDLCKQLMAQHSDISCENIRLRKAGDDLWEFAKVSDTLARKELRKVLNAWNAAKEGKPSV